MSKQKPHSAELAAHAIKSLQEILDIDGPSIVILNTMGHAYMTLGQFNEAARAYQQSLDIDSKDHIANYFLNEIKDKISADQPRVIRQFEPA